MTEKRKRPRARWIAGGLGIVLVIVAIVAATRPSYQATQIGSPLDGKLAPPFSGTDFAGQPVSLSSFKGRWVYVNFFASWCPPCQTEEPSLIDFAFEQSKVPDGAKVVSIVFNDSDSVARSFVAKWGDTWPVLPDDAGAIANSFGVESPPMTFLVGPTGIVDGVWTGPATSGQLTSMLDQAKRSA